MSSTNKTNDFSNFGWGFEPKKEPFKPNPQLNNFQDFGFSSFGNENSNVASNSGIKSTSTNANGMDDMALFGFTDQNIAPK